MNQRRSTTAAAVLALGAALGGCTGASSGASTLGNIFAYGGTTVPPAAPPVLEDVRCPVVDIVEGGSALRVGSGSQVSIATIARECQARSDGTILVKVGVEGRVLLGPGGSTGRYDAPVRFLIKRGDQVVASKVRRVSGAIPAGETQTGFTVVEDGLVVPPGLGAEYEIEVGLGGSPAAAAGRRRG